MMPVAAQDVAVRFSADGSQIEIGFRTDAGVTAISLEPSQASRLVALLLRRAGEISEKTAIPPPASGEPTLQTPIMSSSVGFGRGRDDDETLISFPVGTLVLTFAVPAPMLIELCRRLLATATPGTAPKSH